MLYKKNVVLQLIIGTISMFILLIILFHILLKPFHKVETYLYHAEKDYISKNWSSVEVSLNKINDLWSKYEILLRILNNKDINDDFKLHLDQCIKLAKYKDNNFIECISVLQDDAKDMTHIIPNP